MCRAQSEMRDLVVMLPGITGSVLEKDGRDLWAISGAAAWRALRTLGRSLDELTLRGDDPEAAELDDGIRATRVMPDFHLVPGLVKVDGYSTLKQLIVDHFRVVPGTVDGPEPANFIEFPYDWRRDNAASARRLQRLVERRLPQWRQWSGAADAKLIVLAHSMGGLVARYYLEVLGGWRDCRALFTFGTPFCGSASALEYLANGYKNLFVDLTEAMRSFTSIYQLLPIYKMVRVNGENRRVAETEGIPGVDRGRAAAAAKFHDEINKAVARHRDDNEYLRERYTLVPIVGIRQPTLQSALLDGGRLRSSGALPSGVDEVFADGDGTVPRLSALPAELARDPRGIFIAERHSSLQSNLSILDGLLERLKQMEAPGLRAILGPGVDRAVRQRAALALDLDDLYTAGEAVELRARLFGAPEPAAALVANLVPLAPAGPRRACRFAAQDDDTWTLTLDLEPGVYRIEARTRRAGPAAPRPVHDVFEVVR